MGTGSDRRLHQRSGSGTLASLVGSVTLRGPLPEARAPSPAVFLDRDGVLNEVTMVGGTAEGPLSDQGLVVGETVAADLALLKERGFALLVVTNQPDVARGRLSVETVHRTNRRLMDVTPVDAVYFCPHDNDQGCRCRKPLAGLIEQAAEDWSVDVKRSCLIGDRWVDIAAAEAAGIDGILLETEYSWNQTSSGSPPEGLVPTFAAPTLGGCVRFVLTSKRYG